MKSHLRLKYQEMHRGRTEHDQSHGLNTARLAPPWRTQTLTGNHRSPGGMSLLSEFSLDNGTKLTDPRTDFRVRELSHRLHRSDKRELTLEPLTPFARSPRSVLLAPQRLG